MLSALLLLIVLFFFYFVLFFSSFFSLKLILRGKAKILEFKNEQDADAPSINCSTLVNIFILFPDQENAQQKYTRIVKQNTL